MRGSGRRHDTTPSAVPVYTLKVGSYTPCSSCHIYVLIVHVPWWWSLRCTLWHFYLACQERQPFQVDWTSNHAQVIHQCAVQKLYLLYRHCLMRLHGCYPFCYSGPAGQWGIDQRQLNNSPQHARHELVHHDVPEVCPKLAQVGIVRGNPLASNLWKQIPYTDLIQSIGEWILKPDLHACSNVAAIAQW